MQLSKESGISIEWQDLFPIVIACAYWQSQYYYLAVGLRSAPFLFN